MQDTGGFLGGYLVTNQWGRPLEFRLSSAVQPNRVQKILYANTLQTYICSDLIGKTLIDKTGLAPHLVVTDTQAALDLRYKLDVPVAWIAQTERAQLRLANTPGTPQVEPVCPSLPVRGAIHCHDHFPDDVQAIAALMDRLAGGLDLAEPFARIREAVGEARKLGVTSRAA